MKMWRSQLDLNYIGNTKHWCEEKTYGWLPLDWHHKIDKRKKTLILCNVFYFWSSILWCCWSGDQYFLFAKFHTNVISKKQLVTYSLFFDQIKILKKEKCKKHFTTFQEISTCILVIWWHFLKKFLTFWASPKNLLPFHATSFLGCSQSMQHHEIEI
jgi:hypothetical protein